MLEQLDWSDLYGSLSAELTVCCFQTQALMETHVVLEAQFLESNGDLERVRGAFAVECDVGVHVGG